MATAVVKAAADAAWPEGNEEEVGRRVSRRATGTRSAAGRRRGKTCLPKALAVKLGPAIATRPPIAARRPRPGIVASTAAAVNQIRLWLAEVDSFFTTRSA